MTDDAYDLDDEIDPYEDIDPHDYYGWLAATPPAQLGPAIHTTLDAIKRLTVADRDSISTRYNDAYDAEPDRYDDAGTRAEQAYDDHPIGASSSCAGTTDIAQWVDAVRLRIDPALAWVLMAVALRDHGAITEGDFEILTHCWTASGRSLPDRISDADRATLVQWWRDCDIRPYEFPGLDDEFLPKEQGVSL